jgi:hypothetical protein
LRASRRDAGSSITSGRPLLFPSDGIGAVGPV